MDISSAHAAGTEGAVLPVARFLREPLEHRVDFSFCTLVASDTRYERFLTSAAAKGFTEENSEFIALDNRDQNRFDGYGALRRALPECTGRYVIFVHDDVEFTENDADDLRRVLDELTEMDPDWRLAGNAGAPFGEGRRVETVTHITDAERRGEIKAPVRVESLDENFFIMRRRYPVPNSFDLDGFHLYATDLCLMNEVMGGHTYVIPFMLMHHSGGEGSDAFKKNYAAFVSKYRPFMRGRHVTAPCARMDFGWRSIFNKVVHKEAGEATKAAKRV